MITRRALLQRGLGLGGLSLLPGCGQIRRFFQPEVSSTAIDIHAHIFNGRDVPLVGFLQQSILRDPHQPVESAPVSAGFLKLLKTVMLSGTPRASQELATLGEQGIAPASDEDAVQRDERNVADGLAEFSRNLGRQTAGLRTTRTEEEQVLDRIAAEVGQPNLRSSIQTPENQGRALAAEIFRPGTDALTQGAPRSYRHRSAFMQTIRWAGLLTRPRVDILAELGRLYGGPEGIRIFSPSLVDFSAWFLTEETVTPTEDLITLFSAIAKGYQDAVILNFAPFCPLKAALETEDDPNVDTLRHVRLAVLESGFAGVKLYPPMGFAPAGNDRIDITWAPRKPKAGGAALDAELFKLYEWCVANDVPIKAHANNSIAAGPNTGAYADPAGWRAVLDRPRLTDLRLNLAHFGGFDESAPAGALATGVDWEETLAGMLEDYPNLFFDLSYWTDAADPDSPSRTRVMQRVATLLGRTPKMEERMMYGSDWSMIGRVPSHPQYLAGVQNALTELELGDADRDRVMGGNAARYLGLVSDSAQKSRLSEFFAGHSIYEEILDSG
ncbi:MAG TPA: amidohydrolase family protein [Roseovarius sp.]